MKFHATALATFFVVCSTALTEGILLAQERRDYLVYKFKDLDLETRSVIDKFNGELSKHSEGCSIERDRVAESFITQVSKSTICGASLALVYYANPPQARIPAGALALVACGVDVPSAVKQRALAKAKLKECEAMENIAEKYKAHCAGKTRLVFAYKDSLYCYAAGDRDLQLFVFDFKNKELKIRK